MRLLVLASLLAIATVVPAQQQGMTNGDIIKMQAAGMGDSIILSAIDGSPAAYDISADGLIALKSAHVSDATIAAMQRKAAELNAAISDPDGTAMPGGLPPGVEDSGLYFRQRGGSWQAVEPSMVNIHSGGFIKEMATDGIIKQDQNGRVQGGRSANRLTTADDLLIYAREDAEASDYVLVRFREHTDYREFRSVTGGVFHSRGGAERDEMPFHTRRIAPHVYQLSFDQPLKKGEYGVLPPGASSASLASSGKIYTFSIVE